jgi:hypothetical protein
MANPPQPGAFKLKSAARYLSISELTLRRLVARGLIKASRALQARLKASFSPYKPTEKVALPRSPLRFDHDATYRTMILPV